MVKPRGKVSRQHTPKPAHFKIFEPQFEIAAWCKDNQSKTQPEQVHFLIHWPADFEGIPPMAIRFKSPDTLGFLIEELNRYRNTVWPNCAPVKLEKEHK